MSDGIAGFSTGQLVVGALVLVSFVFIVTRSDFRRRLASTPRVRIVSLTALGLVAVALVARVGGLI